jgi:hypothetical protein
MSFPQAVKSGAGMDGCYCVCRNVRTKRTRSGARWAYDRPGNVRDKRGKRDKGVWDMLVVLIVGLPKCAVDV